MNLNMLVVCMKVLDRYLCISLKKMLHLRGSQCNDLKKR